uniref:Uncharacterized protein n=1 Tax=Arundo donax TaxID=35708 RepID=A0A0A8Y8F4_ARUDO
MKHQMARLTRQFQAVTRVILRAILRAW